MVESFLQGQRQRQRWAGQGVTGGQNRPGEPSLAMLPQPTLARAGGTQGRPAAVPGHLLSQRQGDRLPGTRAQWGTDPFLCKCKTVWNQERGGTRLGTDLSSPSRHPVPPGSAYESPQRAYLTRRDKAAFVAPRQLWSC